MKKHIINSTAICLVAAWASQSLAYAQGRPGGRLERARESWERATQRAQPRGPLDGLNQRYDDARNEALNDAKKIADQYEGNDVFLPKNQKALDTYLSALTQLDEHSSSQCERRLDDPRLSRQRTAQEGREAYANCGRSADKVRTALSRMDAVLANWTANLPASADSLKEIDSAYSGYGLYLGRSGPASRRASSLAKDRLDLRRQQIETQIRPELVRLVSQPGNRPLIDQMFSTDDNLRMFYRNQQRNSVEVAAARDHAASPAVKQFVQSSNGQVTNAAVQSLLSAPAFFVARSTNLLKSNERSVTLNALAYQYGFYPEVKNATCSPIKSGTRCTYDMKVGVTIGVFGATMPAIDSEWTKRTDVFVSGPNGLQSAALDKVMHPIAAVISGSGSGGGSGDPGDDRRKKCLNDQLNVAMSGDMGSAAAMSFCS